MQVRELSSTLKNVKLKNLWDCNDIAKDTVFQNKISKALQNLVSKAQFKYITARTETHL